MKAQAQRQARARLEDAARADQLPKAGNEQWAAAVSVGLIGRVLIATTYGNGNGDEPAKIAPALLADAMTLLTPARADVDRLEVQLLSVKPSQWPSNAYNAEPRQSRADSPNAISDGT